MMDEVVYLITNQVIAINTVQIRLYSADEPISLGSTLNRSKQSRLVNETYPTIFEEIVSTIKNHKERI